MPAVVVEQHHAGGQRERDVGLFVVVVIGGGAGDGCSRDRESTRRDALEPAVPRGAEEHDRVSWRCRARRQGEIVHESIAVCVEEAPAGSNPVPSLSSSRLEEMGWGRPRT